MHRIDTPTAQTDKFGVGKNGFTRGNPQTGVPATALDDDYFDAVQEELAGVIEAADIVLDKSNRAQVLAAIKKLIGSETNTKYLKIASNLAEIAAAGQVAIADTRANIDVYSKSEVNARIPYGVPTGSILQLAGTTAPAGTLLCPTSATNVSRTTYAALFAYIGTIWGAGDGSTTFGIPWFPEGYTAVQSDGNVGGTTVGQVISHSHTIVSQGAGASGSTSATLGGSGSTSTNPAGGPANLAAGRKVLYCIRY